MVTSRIAHHSIIHRHRRGYRSGLLQVFNIIITIIIVARRVNNDDALISVCRARYAFRLGRHTICFEIGSSDFRAPTHIIYIYNTATVIFFNIRYTGVSLYWRLWIFINCCSGGGGGTTAAAQRNRYGREKHKIYERARTGRRRLSRVPKARFQLFQFISSGIWRSCSSFRVNNPVWAPAIPPVPAADPQVVPGAGRVSFVVISAQWPCFSWLHLSPLLTEFVNYNILERTADKTIQKDSFVPPP